MGIRPSRAPRTADTLPEGREIKVSSHCFYIGSDFMSVNNTKRHFMSVNNAKRHFTSVNNKNDILRS